MEATGPLKGVKVLDVTINMAGPTVSLHLADLGADVIKIENPAGGDDTRRFAPPEVAGEAASFMMLNRNKRGMALNLKTEEGKAIFRRLAREADVVVENFLRDTMDRLGLGYEALREENPGLIYCGISGFGRTGPYADRGGLDLVAQGMSGLMSITGEGNGRPAVKVGSPICDVMAGLAGALGVVSALYHRKESGDGQFVDTSLLEVGVISTYHQAAMFLATGESPKALGTVHPLSAPYQAFRVKDGEITVAAGSDVRWARLAEALGVPGLIKDPRFLSAPQRMKNLPELQEILAPLFMTKTRAEWLTYLKEKQVPAGPILSIGEMTEDPQVLAREMITEVEHSRIGPMKTIGAPIKFSKTPANVRRAAPLLGEHSAEILREYGYSDSEISRLAEKGAVTGPGLVPAGGRPASNVAAE